MDTAVKNMTIYEGLAQAFAAEGVDHIFGLMGDGNMHWVTAMKDLPGMNTFHARHEHCATAMAMGYYSATGKVGVASVTCGPGFTQIMTQLSIASRAHAPIVVFAGETPQGAKWYGQQIEQYPLGVATGAHYISAHSTKLMYQYVREAFRIARMEKRPVVLGVPYDLQLQQMPNIGAYVPASTVTPVIPPVPPNPEQLELVAKKLAAAKCAVFIAGRGTLWAGAKNDVEQLAEASGAMLSTTLPMRGMFDDNPFSLGISGGFARSIAREVFGKADLVIGVGARLSYYTVDADSLFPQAEVVQIDLDPVGSYEGLQVADIYMKADAKLTAVELLKRIKASGKTASTIRTPELAKRIKEEPADGDPIAIEPGLLDPRAVFAEFEKELPKDYDMICGSGHQSYFHTVMRGGDPAKYHAFREFGAIGSGLSYCIGIAATRKNGKVILFEGDGSLIMHIQELELAKRQGIKFMVFCLNDGAYGSEIHKLRAEHIDETGAIFGRPDFASIAKGFGLRGVTITDLKQLKGLMAEYEAGNTAMIVDVHVSDKVTSPKMRSAVKAGHGVR